MKKNVMWFGITFLLVLGLVLSSCSNTSTGTTTAAAVTTTTTAAAVTTTTTAAAVTTTSTIISSTSPVTTSAAATPQYGGTLTVLVDNANGQDPTFNPMPFPWFTQYQDPYLEWLSVGDIDKYGPRGNDVFSFQLQQYVPDTYAGPDLATSWTIQVNPGGSCVMTFDLRHGVMWTGNTKIGMAPREVVASDVVYSINRCIATPGPGGTLSMVTSVTALDNYTVAVNLSRFTSNWSEQSFGGGMGMGMIYPHEWVDAGPNDWRNTVGSGPYILTSFVSGSGLEYTRNPNYWGQTTINGKQYQLPFTDKLSEPIIADASTIVAAVRTGKIDWSPYVASQYQTSLSTTAGLKILKYSSGTINMIEMNRMASVTLSNNAVRQAMMIGTDIPTISSVIFNTDVYFSYPFAPGTPPFIPLNQLPAAAQTLWTYNPTLAKQMLAQAGYPNGFTVTLDTTATYTDLCNALSAMWAKIGVTANIKVDDATTDASLFSNVTYKDMIVNGWTMNSPVTSLNLARSGNPGDMYAPGDSNGFDAQYNAIDATVDASARTALEQKLGLALMEDCPLIPFGTAYMLNCYWPWVENYYGEVDAGVECQIPMIERIWINQSLK